SSLFFFFTDPAPTVIYSLSLHDALPISPVLAQLVRETAGVRLRARDVVGLDGHHQLIETGEIVGVLLVTLDEGLILRQQIASRRDEAELVHRVRERRDGAEHAEQHGDERPGARETND